MQTQGLDGDVTSSRPCVCPNSSPVCVYVVGVLFSKGQLWDLGPTLIKYDFILIYLLSALAKTLNPNKIIVTGSSS